MKKSALNRQTITIIFVLGILVLISASILAYMNSRDQIDSEDYIIQSYNKTILIDNIYTAVTNAESSRRGYYITNDKQFLVPFNEAFASVDSLFIDLKKSTADNPVQQANVDTLRLLVSERFQMFIDGINLQQAKGNNPRLHQNLIDKSRVLQNDIKNIVVKMKQAEQNILMQKRKMAETSYQFTYYTLIGGVAISCIIFISMFIVLLNKASKTFEMENQEITREELEQIVKERTAEISQINHKLYKKVDELETMDKALKRSEQYYRMLFDQAHDGIIIFSPEEEKVLDMNKQACIMYGFTREEFKGLSLKSISKNAPEGSKNLKSTLEKGYDHNFQSVHYKKDLTEMLIEINASVISYNGKPAILSLNRDITDRILKVF